MKMSALLFLSFALLATGCSRHPERLVPDGHESWKTTTDEELNYPIPGHEEHFRRIFINSIGEGVTTELRGGRVFYDYPEETVIIKEVYETLEPTPADKPAALTVMIKRTGDLRARSGWIWVVKDTVSGAERIIDYEFCFDCHGNANERHPYGDGNPSGEYRDYVFFPFRPR